MIILFRMWKLWQLKTKWELALFQFLDQQLKNPEDFEQKLVHEVVKLISNTNNLDENK